VSSVDDGRRYWDRNARRYDRSLSLLGRPFPRMLALIVEEIRGAALVLEVGAGTGQVTTAIAGVATKVVATDYSAAMVERLRSRVTSVGLTNVDCRTGDLYTLDFPPASFDAVVAANVLHLVPDVPRALAALKSVLRAGGRLITPTFCHAETWPARLASAISLTGFPAQRRFTADSLAKTIESTGAEILMHETIPGLIPIAFVSAAWPPTRNAHG